MNHNIRILALAGLVALSGTQQLHAADADAEAAPPAAVAGDKLAISTAKIHVAAIVRQDVDALEKTYAAEVGLIPGHEFLKDEYGLTKPGGRARGATVEREKLLAAMKKAVADRPPRPADRVDKMLASLTYTPLDAVPGEFATDPSDPVDTPDGKLRFDIKKGDVLVKVAPPKGDFLLLQLRQIKSAWKVVAEYVD
jgi:hypothetical protein